MVGSIMKGLRKLGNSNTSREVFLTELRENDSKPISQDLIEKRYQEESGKEKWKKVNTRILFLPKNLETTKEALKSYLKEKQLKRDEELTFKMGEMEITIGRYTEKGRTITFKSKGRYYVNSLLEPIYEIQDYPYCITIRGKIVDSEVDIFKERFANVSTNDAIHIGKDVSEYVEVDYTLTSINAGEEFSERYSVQLRSSNNEEKEEKIIQQLLDAHPDYSVDEKRYLWKSLEVNDCVKSMSLETEANASLPHLANIFEPYKEPKTCKDFQTEDVKKGVNSVIEHCKMIYVVLTEVCQEVIEEQEGISH